MRFMKGGRYKHRNTVDAALYVVASEILPTGDAKLTVWWNYGVYGGLVEGPDDIIVKFEDFNNWKEVSNG